MEAQERVERAAATRRRAAIAADRAYLAELADVKRDLRSVTAAISGTAA